MRMYILVFALVVGIFSGYDIVAQSTKRIEASSVEAFFAMGDKLSSGIEPTEKEWEDLFATQGLNKAIKETFPERAESTRRVMGYVFDPKQAAKKDSILNVPMSDILNDLDALLMRIMLNNFMETKAHKTAILEKIRTTDQTVINRKACDRLKHFLVNPIDSLIIPIPVSLVCMEPDALSLSGTVVWDSNLFRILTDDEIVDLLTHEMYHAYRRHFYRESNASRLMNLLNLWNNEGIADLIDKKSVSDLSVAFIRYGLPYSYVESYNEVYQNTPRMLKHLEELTLSYIHHEITEDQFNQHLSEFGHYGGHPNGYYMSTLIRKAGFEQEMLRHFDKPVAFIKLYNKSVDSEFKLSDEFLQCLDRF